MSGLPVIALGPRGGKIVGYDGLSNPIYQGSAAAKQLASDSGVSEGSFGLSELLDQLHSSLGVSATEHGGGWILSVKVPPSIIKTATTAKVEAVLRSRLQAALAAGKNQLSQTGKIVVKTKPDGSMVAGVLVLPTGKEGDWTLDAAGLPAHALAAPHGYQAASLVSMAMATPMLDAMKQAVPGANPAQLLHETWHGSLVGPSEILHFETADGSRYTLATSKADQPLAVTVDVPAGATHWALKNADTYKTIMPKGAVEKTVLASPKTLVFDTTQEALCYVAGYASSLGGKLAAQINGVFVPSIQAVATDKPIAVSDAASVLETEHTVGDATVPHDLHIDDLQAPPPVPKPTVPTWEQVTASLKKKGAAIPHEPSSLKALVAQAASVTVHGGTGNFMPPSTLSGDEATMNWSNPGLVDAMKAVAAKGVQMQPGAHLHLHGGDGLSIKSSSMLGYGGKLLEIFSFGVLTLADDGVHLEPHYIVDDLAGNFVEIPASDFKNIKKPMYSNSMSAVLKASGIAKIVAAGMGKDLSAKAADSTVVVDAPIAAKVEVVGDSFEVTIGDETPVVVEDPPAFVQAVAQAAVHGEAMAADAQAPQPEPLAVALPAEPVPAVLDSTPIALMKAHTHQPLLHDFPLGPITDAPTGWPLWAAEMPPGTTCKAVDKDGNVWAVALHVPDPIMFDGPVPSAEIVLTNLSSEAGDLHSGLTPEAALQVLSDTGDLDPASDAFQATLAHWFSGLPIVIDKAGKTHLDTIPAVVELHTIDDATELHPEDLAKYQAVNPSVGDAISLPESEVANVVKPLKKKGAGLPEFLQQMAGGVQWKWQVTLGDQTDVVQLNTWFQKGTYGKPIVADLPNPTTWDAAGVTVLLHDDCSLTIEHAGKTWHFAPHLAAKDKTSALAGKLGFGSVEHFAQPDDDTAAPAPVVQEAFQSVGDVAKHAMGAIDTLKWIVDGPDGTHEKPVKVNTWAKKGTYAPDKAKGLVHPAMWTTQTVDVVMGDIPKFVVSQNGQSWTFTPVGSAADMTKITKNLASAQAADTGANDPPPVAEAESVSDSKHYGIAELMAIGGHLNLAASLKVGDVLGKGAWKKWTISELPDGVQFEVGGQVYKHVGPGAMDFSNENGYSFLDVWLQPLTVVELPAATPAVIVTPEAATTLDETGGVVQAGDQETLAALPTGTAVQWSDGTAAEKSETGWDVTNADGTPGIHLPSDFASSEDVTVTATPLAPEPEPVASDEATAPAPTNVQMIADVVATYGHAGDEAFADKQKVVIDGKKLANGSLFVTLKGATWPIKQAIKDALVDAAWNADQKAWVVESAEPNKLCVDLGFLHINLKNKDKVVLHKDFVALLQAEQGLAPAVATVPAPPPPIETVVPDGHHVPTSPSEAFLATVLATPGLWKVKAPGKETYSKVDMQAWAADPKKTAGLVSHKNAGFAPSMFPSPSNWENLKSVDLKVEVDEGVVSVSISSKTYPNIGGTWEFVPPGGPAAKAKVHAAAIGYVEPGSKKAKAADKGKKAVQAVIVGEVPQAVAVITKPAEPPSAGMKQSLSVPEAMQHWGYEIVHEGTFDLPKKKKTDLGWVDDGTESRDVIIALVPEDTTPLAGELMLLASGVPTKMPGQHMVVRLPVVMGADGKWKIVKAGTPGAVEKHCFLIDKVKADKAKPVAVTTDAHLGEALFDDVPDVVKQYASHTGVSYHGLVKLTAKNAGKNVAAGESLFVVVSKSHMAVFKADGSLLEDYPVELGKYVQGKPNLIREVFDKHVGLSSLAGDNWQKFVRVLHAGSLKVPDPPEIIKNIALNNVVIATQAAINDGSVSYHSTLGADAPGAIYGVPIAKEPWQGYVVFGTGNQPDTLYDNGGNIIAVGTGEVLAFGGWQDKHSIIAAAGTNTFKHKYQPKPKAELSTETIMAGGIESDAHGMFASRVGIGDLLSRADESIKDCPMEGQDAFLMAAPGTANGQARVHRVKKLDGSVANRVSFTVGAHFGTMLKAAANTLKIKGEAKSDETAKMAAFQYDATLGMFAELASAESHYISSQTGMSSAVPRSSLTGKLDVDGHKVGWRVFTTVNDYEVQFEFPQGADLKIREAAQKALTELMAAGGKAIEPERCDVLGAQSGEDFRKFVAVRRFNPTGLYANGAYGKATSLHDIVAGFHPSVDHAALTEKFKDLNNKAEAKLPLKAVAHGGQLNYYFDITGQQDVASTYLKTGIGSASKDPVGRVLAVLENGLMGVRDRMSHLGATYQKGASISSDVGNGDADVVFMRPGPNGSGSPTTSSLGGDITAIINPAILGDVLFTMTSGDAFGSPESQQSGTQGKTIAGVLKTVKTGHVQELLTRSVPTSALTQIVVPAENWQMIVTGLKQRGYDEINGMPVEKFIVARGGYYANSSGGTSISTVEDVIGHSKKHYHEINTKTPGKQVGAA
jgi:hypothetical protein